MLLFIRETRGLLRSFAPAKLFTGLSGIPEHRALLDEKQKLVRRGERESYYKLL
jgi:hypothetical protein